MNAGFEFVSNGPSTLEMNIADCPSNGENLAFRFSSEGQGIVVKKNSHYQYDANGNITYDPTKDLHFTYNHLNLPATTTDSNGNTIKWIWTAEGRKLAKIVNNTSTRKYLGDMEWNDQLELVNHKKWTNKSHSES